MNRFTSNRDVDFHSAFLELYIHELLRRTHHKVELHPGLPSIPRQPDFLATAEDGSECIVECTVATETSDRDRGADMLLGELYDAINRISSPDFSLCLEKTGAPRSPVRITEWTRQIRTWLESLDYEMVSGLVLANEVDRLPYLALQHDGLRIVFTPIPRRPSRRGIAGRLIGMQAGEGCFVTSRDDIHGKLKDKSGSYGAMDRPYLIVVNCLGENADDEEIRLAVFGTRGLWKDPRIPTHRRVSAVLAFRHLFPWSAGRVETRLFLNPNSKFPYNGLLLSVPRSTHDADFDGTHPGRLMEIPLGWPEAPKVDQG